MYLMDIVNKSKLKILFKCVNNMIIIKLVLNVVLIISQVVMYVNQYLLQIVQKLKIELLVKVVNLDINQKHLKVLQVVLKFKKNKFKIVKLFLILLHLLVLNVKMDIMYQMDNVNLLKIKYQCVKNMILLTYVLNVINTLY